MTMNFKEIRMVTKQPRRDDSDILVYDEVRDITWNIVTVLAVEDEGNYCTSLGRPYNYLIVISAYPQSTVCSGALR